MKKFRLAFLALATLALLATGCGGGGGGGSDEDDVTPVAESSGAGGSGTGSGGSGGGSGSTSVPVGLVFVQGTTFNGTTAVTGSEVFISGRTITIPNLIVCDHEVTQAEYQSVMGVNPSGYSGLNKPVEQVSWYDAITYCNKRSLAENLTPCYTVSGVDFSGNVTVPLSDNATWNAATCNFNANGYRLPTEAEWEYLARGGNLTNNGQTTYSGSNTIGDVAWYDINVYDLGSSSPSYGAHQVKTKNPNGKNLYDMSGNVREWCWDWWSDTITAGTPPTGASSGSGRILRGGSWHGDASDCTVSYRGGGYTGYHVTYIGFRVVRSRSE